MMNFIIIVCGVLGCIGAYAKLNEPGVFVETPLRMFSFFLLIMTVITMIIISIMEMLR